MLSLAVVCVAATGLSALAGLRPGIRRTLLALAVAAAGLCAALVAAGLPAHLLEPAHWGELRDEIQDGIGGIEEAQLPYDGADEWIRRSLVLGAPALVALAAAIAFWPGGRRGRRRAVALAILLIVYGVGATLDNPGRGDPLGAGAAAARCRLALGRPARRRVGGRRRWWWRSRPGCSRCRSPRGSTPGLVGLRELVVVRRRSATVELRLEPRLRAARLAARRDDDDDGPQRDAAVLEGERAGPLRRLRLAAAP